MIGVNIITGLPPVILTRHSRNEKAGPDLVRWQVYIFAVLLCGLLIPAYAVEVDAEPPEPVQITQQDSNYLVVTPLYKAHINDNGNLHSLVVNGVELLDDRVPGSAGSSFFVDHPLALPKITLAGSTIIASDGIYSIKYEFARTSIALTLRQTSAKRAAYVTFCSTSMAFLENISESTALPDMATVPSDHDWTDVKVSTAGGEFLQLLHGSRTWGSELEVSIRKAISPSAARSGNSAILRRIKSISCSSSPAWMRRASPRSTS